MESLNESVGMEPLLQAQTTRNPVARLWACLRKTPENAARRVAILPTTQTKRRPTNLVVNTKYNILTFLPLVLFNQFKYFQNFFFLMMAMTQFVSALKVGMTFTYFAPLCFVIGLTMIREAYEDIKRYYRDLKANSTKYKVLTKQGSIEIQSRFLNVGDIVEVQSGQIVPADMILLYSDQPEGHLFIRTDQLDGETDWKLRRAVKSTQRLLAVENNEQLFSGDLSCEINAPSDKIYHFDGLFTQTLGFDEVKEKLTLENTLWASTNITIGRGFGLIVYCGKHTRISMGAEQAHPKIGIFDLQILFATMLITTTTIILLQGPESSQVVSQFIRKLILVSYIFPLSVKVNIELARLVYCQRINTDPGMKNAIARNSLINEDMARIKYLLTDKTGTLTLNQMVFQSIVVKEGKWEEADESMNHEDQWKNKGEDWRRMVKAMALCHNVTPVMVDGQRQFQASSPDEVTLVQTAEKLGVRILERTQSRISIEIEWSGREDYEIVQNFHFSSERKRMGILLRTGDKYVFYLKGADSVMCSLMADNSEEKFARDNCKKEAEKGLRTLVFAWKTLTAEQIKPWINDFQKITLKLQADSKSLQTHINVLEKGSQFIGISALEDKLQENLQKTLQNLKKAGIRVWMVTGDKMQTAEAVSISTGIRPHGSSVIRAVQIDNQIQIQQILSEIQNAQRGVGLVIDGRSLGTVLDSGIAERFFNIAMKLETVVCCRCTPTQKGKLVQNLRKYNKQPNDRIAAIGDGGNDVGMIQNADIGVGLAGKQGKQAALAADYSLEKFMHLQKLLLWHGRLSYKRSSMLVQFVIYRGMLIGVMHAAFIVTFNFISVPLFNSLLQVGYTSLFTFFPAISMVFDEDISLVVCQEHPELYRDIQKGKLLTISTFIRWSCMAIYQAITIYTLTILWFSDEQTEVQTIGFSAIILAQYFVSQLELSRPSFISLSSIIISIGIYTGSMFFLASLGVVKITHAIHLLILLGITMLAVLPACIERQIRRRCWPEPHEVVMRTVDRGCILSTSILKEKEDYRPMVESHELQ